MRFVCIVCDFIWLCLCLDLFLVCAWCMICGWFGLFCVCVLAVSCYLIWWGYISCVVLVCFVLICVVFGFSLLVVLFKGCGLCF